MLKLFADWLVFTVLKLPKESNFAEALDFFVYDSIKILLLLFVMIAVIGFLRTFIPAQKIKDSLSRSGWLGNFIASAFGAVTPFCSCSSIPIFMSFVNMRIPLGIAFSFLITSPIINEYLVVLMLGFFGWKITLTYVVSGILIGVFVGIILGKMKLEKYIVQDLVSGDTDVPDGKKRYNKFRDRVSFGIGEAISIVRKLWLWVLVGVALGALIHNYIPKEMVESITSKARIFSVPIATVIGIPMYGSCVAIIPIAIVLFQKGFPLGTTLAFMMSVSALSLPEAIMLRRVMKLQLIAIFFGVTTLVIIATGYLFNILQGVLI